MIGTLGMPHWCPRGIRCYSLCCAHLVADLSQQRAESIKSVDLRPHFPCGDLTSPDSVPQQPCSPGAFATTGDGVTRDAKHLTHSAAVVLADKTVVAEGETLIHGSSVLAGGQFLSL